VQSAIYSASRTQGVATERSVRLAAIAALGLRSLDSPRARICLKCWLQPPVPGSLIAAYGTERITAILAPAWEPSLRQSIFRSVLHVAIICSSCTLVANAGIINGDFETGDLTGWLYTKSGSISVQPIDGSYKLVLESNGGGRPLAFQTQESPLHPFVTLEYSGQFSSEGSIGFEISITENAFRRPIVAKSYLVGESETIPTTKITFPVQLIPGSIISFSIARSPQDNLSTGMLIVDNVEFVPEPSAFVLLAMGSVACVCCRRQRRG